jgi:hypothetical protein
VKPELNECLEFLERWKPEGPWVLTAICSDDKDSIGGRRIETKTFDETNKNEIRTWIREHQEHERNIYFTVNTLTRKVNKKASREDVARVDVLHVDIDPRPDKPLEREQKRILKLMERPEGVMPPDLVIFSGGGYQGFWFLDESLDINGDLRRAERAKLYNLQIENLMGGDGCHNVDRIMRLPGSVNWPNAKKRAKGREPALAKVVKWTEDRHSIKEFTPAPKVQDGLSGMGGGGATVEISGNIQRLGSLDELPKGVKDRVKVAIVQGRDDDEPLQKDNSRSAWVFYVICELIRAGVADETVYSIITDPDFKISESILDKGSSHAIERYAIRQIARAKEYAYQPELRELNDKYALVESVGGKCRIVKEHMEPEPEIEYLTIEGFMRTHGNRFVTIDQEKGKKMALGQWWMTHPMRRTYSRIVFDPSGEYTDELNLWRGFTCEALPGDCTLFLDHCKKVLCKGVDEYYQYLLGWMANTVQNPGRPGEVAVVFRGKQGTGKGTFAKIFGSLFGCHYKHLVNAEHILGKFNSQLRDAVVVFADEAFYAGNKKHESALKALITEETMMVELKGVDAVEARNYVHLIIASNEDWVVPARWDDRRFFILETSDEQRMNDVYFEAMLRQMDDGGREALLHYLLTYDMSKFNLRKVPKTEELRAQQMASITPEQSWWLRKLQDGKILPDSSGWEEFAMKDALLDDYLDHMRNTRDSRHASRIHLGKFLQKVCPTLDSRQEQRTLIYTDSKGREQERRRPWVFVFPPLEDCRAMWDEMFGEQSWQEILQDSDAEPQGMEHF